MITNPQTTGLDYYYSSLAYKKRIKVGKNYITNIVLHSNNYHYFKNTNVREGFEHQ